MAVTTINSTYFKITENIADAHTDYFVINPFDASGNLFKRIQIDVDIREWNQNTIIIYVPEISTLNFNFDLEITITNYSTGFILMRPIVVAGNNIDQWYFRGALFDIGSMVWTPESYNVQPNNGSNPLGSWCVVPYYIGGHGLGLATAISETTEPTPEFTIDWSLYAPKKKKPSFLIR